MAASKLLKGSELKIKLKRRKIKIDDLVAHYGLSRQTVSRYLNDHMAMPATFIIQVAEFANMSIYDFTTGYIKESEVMTPKIHAPDKYTTHEEIETIASEELEEYKTPDARMIVDFTSIEERLVSIEKEIEDIKKQIKKH